MITSRCNQRLSRILRLLTDRHTPSPMAFLNEILGRPENERPFVILVVGYPSPDATVPELRRKSLEEIAIFIE